MNTAQLALFRGARGGGAVELRVSLNEPDQVRCSGALLHPPAGHRGQQHLPWNVRSCGCWYATSFRRSIFLSRL
jgi:hypothetical protein